MRFRSLMILAVLVVGAGGIAAYYFPREQPAAQRTETKAVEPQQPTEPQVPPAQSTVEGSNTAGSGERAAQPPAQEPTSETAQARAAGERSSKGDRPSRSTPEVAEAPAQTDLRSAVPGHEPAHAATQKAVLSPNELSSMSVRSLQEALSRAGFNPGRPDGKWGARTERAMRAFQERKQLPAPGTLDAPTVEVLGLDPAQFAQGEPGAAHAEER